MGIRFFCPQGHRLHVKSFLAGKRGICPDCGVGVDIPLRSDPRAEKKKGAIDGDAETVFDPEIPLPPQANAAPHTQPGVTPVSIPTLPVAGAPNLQPTFGASATAVAAVPVPTMPVAPVQASPQVQPVAAQPIVARAATPVGAMPVTAVPVGVPSMPAVAAIPSIDPITEAPMSIWYVRPAAGGQFGPARGDIMRTWLGEGRVTADSMVWREGWTDWRVASQVFPNLPATAPDVAPASETPRRSPRVRPKSSSGLGIAIVVLLALVAVGLAAALIYVLNRGTA